MAKFMAKVRTSMAFPAALFAFAAFRAVPGAAQSCANDNCTDGSADTATLLQVRPASVARSLNVCETDSKLCECKIGDKPCNELDGLKPPDGKVWRGTTMGKTSMIGQGDPTKYAEQYGAPLHILRVFQKGGISVEQKKFVKNGGILWYNISPQVWKDVVDGKYDKKKIPKWIRVVRSFAPAKVMVCLAHEPDHDLPHQTADNYKKMWKHVQGKFDEAGVTNAVWVMDYSVGIGRGKNGQWENALSVWPGAESRVDWLFFNVFERRMDVTDDPDFYRNLVKKIYDQLEGASETFVCSGNRCGFNDIPWGIGAFGTPTQAEPGFKEDHRRNGAVDLADRQKFLQQAKEGMIEDEEGKIPFPRLKAYIYFDSLQSVISEDMKEDYKNYLTGEPWATNSE